MLMISGQHGGHVMHSGTPPRDAFRDLLLCQKPAEGCRRVHGVDVRPYLFKSLLAVNKDVFPPSPLPVGRYQGSVKSL